MRVGLATPVVDSIFASRAASTVGDTETEAGEEVLLASGLDSLFDADHNIYNAGVRRREIKSEVAPAAGDAAVASDSRFDMTGAQDQALRRSMSEAALALRVTRLDAVGQGPSDLPGELCVWRPAREPVGQPRLRCLRGLTSGGKRRSGVVPLPGVR